MSLRHAGRRAAGIAVVASLYVVYTCLHYAAGSRVAAAPGGAAEAAVLLLVVPPLLVLPLTGWGLARRLGAGRAAVGAARAATLIAVAVWAACVAYLRFGPAPPH